MEIERADGSMWPFAEFLGRIRSELAGGAALAERHLEYVRAMHGSDTLSDDFSVLDVRF
jgi:sigma-B regulation protein RsbU (phosphoserine phosphatase)